MLTRWSLSLMAMGLILVGCAPQTPYRAGHDATEVVVADPKLCPELHAASQFRIPVVYVEIDEQGYFQDRSQMEQALALVAAAGKPKYVVVFVHGWFHSARPGDENVRRFKCALNNLQAIDGNIHEDVVGLYIGWRGKSWSLPLMQYATFWDRKNTSEEIGRGSLVEFLIRLERVAKPSPSSLNKLMLIGHSFGGGRVARASAEFPERVTRTVIIDSHMRLDDEKRSTRPFEIGPRRVYPTFEAARGRFRLVPPENRAAPYILDYVAQHSLKEIEGGWTWKFDERLMPKHDDAKARDILGAIEAPVTFIYGDASAIVSRQHAHDIVSCFRNGHGPIAIPQSHHHVLLDQPLSLVAALRGVLY